MGRRPIFLLLVRVMGLDSQALDAPSVSADLRPHCGLIHYGFFKSHLPVNKTKKDPAFSGISFCWCGRWDLNPYVIQHTPLKRACLPIPALPRIQLLLVSSNRLIIRKLPPVVKTRKKKTFDRLSNVKENRFFVRLILRKRKKPLRIRGK